MVVKFRVTATEADTLSLTWTFRNAWDFVFAIMVAVSLSCQSVSTVIWLCGAIFQVEIK